MALADEARAHLSRPTGTCSLERLIVSDPDLGAEIVDALADRTLTSQAISRALVKRGHQISGATVARHRRGDCACR